MAQFVAQCAKNGTVIGATDLLVKENISINVAGAFRRCFAEIRGETPQYV
jgi:hypothetical protein